jgi:hypothetical protein
MLLEREMTSPQPKTHLYQHPGLGDTNCGIFFSGEEWLDKI